MDNVELKKRGLKVTVPRVKILEILEQANSRHLRAEDVYKALLAAGSDVGLATVYRVLTQFEEAGLIKRHNFEGGHSVFELDQGDHHDHMVCVQCGKVEEFFDDTIEKRQEMISARAGFKITDHSLNLYGVCSACQAKSVSVPDIEAETAVTI